MELISTRAFLLPGAPSNFDETRQIKATFASEAAVPMPDWKRLEMVPEVLLMKGCQIPQDKRMPLLNAHMRNGADDILGTGMDMMVEGDMLGGMIEVSETEEKIRKKIKEGHIRSLSIGYSVDETSRVYVAPGERAVIAGREFTGPVNVVQRWTPVEVSLVPIPADQNAKMRGFSSNPFQEGRPQMGPLLRAALVASGMPADLDEPGVRSWLVQRGMPETTLDVEDWYFKNRSKFEQKKPDDSATTGTRATTVVVNNPSPQQTSNTSAPSFDKDAYKRAMQEAEREMIAEKKALREAVTTECKRFGLEGEVSSILEVATNVTEAHREILERLARRQQASSGSALAPSSVEFVAAERDKARAIFETAYTVRALQTAKLTDESRNRVFPKENYAKGWEQYSRHGILELARLCLESEGVRTGALAQDEIAKMALLPRLNQRLYQRAGDPGYHVTGMFADITLNAMNKTMIAAFQERTMTWRQVFRQGASVRDFKAIDRIRMSEAPNPSIWVENTKPTQIAFTDEKESYKVVPYSDVASFGWQLLINDDMDAFTRVPQLMGAAYARGVNATAWAVITDNANLQDGQPLFLETPTGNRLKSNYITGSATPTVSTLGAMRKLMRLQVGVNKPDATASEAILNLTPRFLVVPAALETTAEQLLNSTADPAANLSSAVFNPFRNLTLVVEPLLDANSATAFYIFADTSQIDTVEVTFLQGYETPQTDSWEDQMTSAMYFRITSAWAAKAIDFRGMVKHKGAA